MQNTLRHYAQVYYEFLRTCFAEVATYRLHFVLLIFLDLVFYGISIATVQFIFEQVDSIGPWDRNQFLFFLCFMLAIDHLHMTFISENFWTFSRDLRQGNVDFILLKPTGALFTIFFRNMRPGSLCNVWAPWAGLIWYGSQAGLAWWSWVALPGLLLLGLALLGSLEILLSLSMFWLIESTGINFLRLQVQQLSRWPDFVFRYTVGKFFTIFFPILLVGSAPVRFLLDPRDWHFLAGCLVALLASWWLIRVVLRLGLRAYESASS